MRSPSNQIDPSTGLTMPRMARITVVLPAPLEPSRQAIWPRPTASETSRSIPMGPYRVLTPRSSSTRRLLAEIGLAHFSRGRDGGEGALGDLPPVIERHHALAHAFDHEHVVLDDDHRQPRHLRSHDLQIAHQLGRLLRVHARRGLVEQEQARLRGERAIEQGEEMGGALERAANLDLKSGAPQDEIREPRLPSRVHADQDIVEDGEPQAQPARLEGARNAESRDRMRLESDEAPALE